MSRPEVSFQVGAVRASIFRRDAAGGQTISIGKSSWKSGIGTRTGSEKHAQHERNEVPRQYSPFRSNTNT